AGLSGDIAARVAAAAEPQVQFNTLDRADRSGGAQTAHDCFLRGLYGAHCTPGHADYGLAARCFRRALDLDPNHVPAMAFLPWASAYANQVRNTPSALEFGAMARKALQSARDDARTLAV